MHRELNDIDSNLTKMDTTLDELGTIKILNDLLTIFCQIKVDFEKFDNCLRRFQRNECDMVEYLLFKDIILKRISKCNKLLSQRNSNTNPLIGNGLQNFVLEYSNDLSKTIDTFDIFVEKKFLHQ